MEIYLGNLPYNVTEAELRTFLAGCGELSSVKLIADPETGASKGYAFISLADPSRSQVAVEMLNGKDFGGRCIRVNLSRPRSIAYRGFGGASYSGRVLKDRPFPSYGDPPPGED